MPHVFLYGTLMRGGANHHVLRRLAARFCGATRTAGPRHLVDLGPYPALLPLATEAFPAGVASTVQGEVWELDDSALAELDAFEGCPRLYVRERIELRHDTFADAFVYVLARPLPKRARLIAGGHYRRAGAPLADNAEEVALEPPRPGESR